MSARSDGPDARDTLLDAATTLTEGLDAADTLAISPAPQRPATTSTSAPDLVAGSRLHRYRINRVIGSGGMGTVYEAEDESLQRLGALKVLRDRGGGSALRQDATQRLLREARAMAALAHPNVVQIYDVGVAEAQVYIAMQLVDGRTLREWLAEAPRTVAEIARVLEGAGRGLLAAHAQGIVHRDFKPDNVLVSASGHARVTDFGLARRGEGDPDETPPPIAERTSQPRLPADHDVLRLTHAGIIVGTPAYMAPEQHDGGVIDQRADQFSFCVTAWEALYGQRPFAGVTSPLIYANVIGQRFAEPDARVPVPPVLRAALRRGLAADPADRFPDLLAVLAALAAAVQRPRQRARRRRGWAIAGAIIAAVVVLGAVG